MASGSLGKKFEDQFKENWLDTVKDSWIYRLFDTMGGYSGIANVCDFIGFKSPLLFLIECKEHKGNTFPFSAFRQYQQMSDTYKKNITGLVAGVVLWLSDHDKVIWVPITTFDKIKSEDGKSFNIKMLDNPEYQCLELPSVKKRKFLNTDYSKLIEYYEEKIRC